MKKIILASGSPRRKQFFDDLGIDYEIISSNFEEDMTQDLSIKELSIELALGKAQEVANRINEGVVVGCDTFCSKDGKVLGKPKNEEEAFSMLKSFSGSSLEVHSGLVAIDKYDNKIIKKHDVSTVFFENISDAEILGYIATGEPMDKAGAFAVQEKGSMFIKRIEGSNTNIIGLPMNKLKEIFDELGIFWLKKV